MITGRSGLGYRNSQEGRLRLASITELMVLYETIRIIKNRPHSVSLEVPQLSKQENNRWQEELNHNLAACGCKESAGFMLIAIGVCILLFFTQLGEIEELKASYLFAMAILVMGSSLTGKLIGLAIAHIRAKHLITQLIRRLEIVIAYTPPHSNKGA